MFHEIKSFYKDDQVFYSLLVVIIACVSFGLGRLSVNHDTTKSTQSVAQLQSRATSTPQKTSTLNVRPPATPSAAALPLTVTEKLVASKSGTKYHALHCPGASQIKEENKIYFDTAAAARASGYTPAANCPGLE